MAPSDEGADGEDDGIEVTATGFKVHASESIQPQKYESGVGSFSLEGDLGTHGEDITDGIPDELKDRLYSYQRTLQNIAIAAAKARRDDGPA